MDAFRTGRKAADARGIAATERRRLACELHDGPLQVLIGVVQKMRLAGRILSEDHPANQLVSESEEQVLAAVEAIRRVLHPLHAEPPSGCLLEDRLQAAISRVTSTTPLGVHLSPLPDLSASPEVEEAITGIIGEAVTNAGKHSGARNVWVHVSVTDAMAEICVRDDGTGFDVSVAESEAQLRRSLGLYLMRARAQAVGGIIAIRSHLDAGTEVRARIPLRRAFDDLRRLPPGDETDAVFAPFS